jgi:alginate O-acetyltransferase complex protein AlgJ
MSAQIKDLRLLLLIAFVGVLWLPFLQMHFRSFPEPENTENRELAQAPAGDYVSFADFVDGWERYAVDNFGFRPYLIRWYSALKLTLLGVSPVPSVILGKDSWLFYHSEALADGNTVNDFRGTIPLSHAELVKLQQRLEANQRVFAGENIGYLVVIVPNKSTIYREYMPDNIRTFRHTNRLDQLLDHMRRYSGVRILDLREALFRAKQEHPVYWKTDSHWNSYGAYIGYVEIVRQLSAFLPALTAAPIAGDEVKTESSPSGGDLAQMLFLQDALAEENDTRFSLDDTPGQRPIGTLILRHDSFGDGLYPYLRRHFKELINIAPFAPYHLQAIFEKRPRAVVHVFAERYITQAIHDDFYYQEEKPGQPLALSH